MKNIKRNILYGFAAFLMLSAGGAPAFSQTPVSGGDLKARIDKIQTLIDQKGGKWVAGETSVSNLSQEEWQALVGFSFAPLRAPQLPEVAGERVPASVDWRSDNGNFVTAVRNQKKCGSCWAFALTGALESYVLLTQHKPGASLDLSEQVLLSCSGVGSCNGGTLNADYLQTTGLPLETAYPYAAADGTCSSAASGWQNSTYKIGGWGSVSHSLSSIKAALAKYGPLPTAMMVYEDLMHYKSGVYSYTTGKKLGGHAVLLVGYDDADQAFIVKNSWGPGWGENGFFRVAYSEMSGGVSFALSTIAYQSKNAKDGEAWQNREAGIGASDGGAAWARMAPMFSPALEWK